MQLTRRSVLALGCGALYGGDEELVRAFGRMYNTDFPGAMRLADSYVARNSADPIGYAAQAAASLFSEMDRLGILQTDFFVDDDKLADRKKENQIDQKTRSAFYWATRQCLERGEARVAKDARDRQGLFALSLGNGLITDYMAFIERRQIGSLTYAKNSQRYAVRLLAVDDKFADAYLTTGANEYVVSSLPFFVKWFVKFEQAKGSKAVAVENLKRAARDGKFLGPFARILLTVVALREKRNAEARMWLEGLVKEFPENHLLRKELLKLSQ